MIKRLQTFLTVSFLILILPACSDVDVRPKQILKRFNKCKQYRVEDVDKATLVFDKEVALEECLEDGNWVITPKELTDLRRKYKEIKEEIDKCGKE